MKHIAALAIIALPLASATALAAEPKPADPELASFRAAYLAGSGISYVVVPEAGGERIYRYGEASRRTAKRDAKGYLMFTCTASHVFVPDRPEHKAALLKAKVVRGGEPQFAELDAKYLAGCKNPLVKSALPKKK